MLLMKHKFILLYLVLVFPFLNSFSQFKYIYYFDGSLNSCAKTAAKFTGYGTMENNLVAVRILDNFTQHPVIIAHYTDSSLAVNHGLFTSFFYNGKKESEGNYEKNTENGLWRKWDTSGHMIKSTIYDHGIKTDSAVFYYQPNGKLSEYKSTEIKNDKQQIISYNDTGKIISEALFIGQKGIVKTYTGTEIKIDTVYSKEEIEASFPGGEEGWNRYIRLTIMHNIDELTNDNRSGTCIVRFLIDKDGRVDNVKALTMEGSVLAKITVKAISKGPRWNPAMQYGKAVNAYREQPISFTLQ